MTVFLLVKAPYSPIQNKMSASAKKADAGIELIPYLPPSHLIFRQTMAPTSATNNKTDVNSNGIICFEYKCLTNLHRVVFMKCGWNLRNIKIVDSNVDRKGKADNS